MMVHHKTLLEWSIGDENFHKSLDDIGIDLRLHEDDCLSRWTEEDFDNEKCKNFFFVLEQTYTVKY